VWFRRQVPVRHYIVDFLAPSARLVIEVDGGYHRARSSADTRREMKLTRHGYCVIRLEAELVTHDIETALERIRSALAES
jgi:very-short-patch-repair endonuclease